MITCITCKHLIGAVLVLLFCGTFFLSQVPSQNVAEPSQEILSDRSAESIREAERHPVITPFTHVSADNLRLTNVRPLPEDVRKDVMNPENRRYHLDKWSPDGQWVLFSGVEVPNDPGPYDLTGIYIVKTDGTNEKRVLRSIEYYPDGTWKIWLERAYWFWDSKRVLYQVTYRFPEHPEKPDEVWLESIDINTGKITRHPGIGPHDDLRSFTTARYPKDPIIHYDYDNGIISASTKDGNKHWLVAHGGLGPLSPDKKKILISTPGGQVVYSVDGSGPLSEPIPEGGFYYQWSPDSTKFVYHLAEYDGHFPVASEIYIVNADGTGKRQMTHTVNILEMHPYWLPDGLGVGFTTGLSENKAQSTQYIGDLVIY